MPPLLTSDAAPVPLCVSRRRLAKRKTLPRARCRWMLDSGAYSELSMFGKWTVQPREYARFVRRCVDEIGNLDWAAPQDWMSEAHIRARTGLSSCEHQARTVGNYLDLKGIDPGLPFCPVVTGDPESPGEYDRCAEMYERAGISLAASPVVGLGGVCRLQHADQAGKILDVLELRGLRLHGFGFKVQGLARYGHRFATADSLAWSYDARRDWPLPGHTHKNCANCRDWALRWRARMFTTTGGNPCQETFYLGTHEVHWLSWG